MAKTKEYNILQPANKKGRHVNKVLIFLRIILTPLIFLMYPFKFYGNRKVKDGACIYVGNHYRIWDVLFPALTTSEGIHFVGKSELKKSFIWGFCKAVKIIPVNRNGDDVKSLMDILKCLKNNEKIAIFPEGTRNKENVDMLPFHSGAAMLAIKTKTPIVPILIYEKPRHFHLNHVIVGEPFELSEYYGKKLTAEELDGVAEELRQKLLTMRAEHKKELENKKNKTEQK